jgi:alpha-methylacyl-CoA racemase
MVRQMAYGLAHAVKTHSTLVNVFPGITYFNRVKGAPFYEVYETKDGKYISIGALEPQFYAILVKKLGLEDRLQVGRLYCYLFSKLSQQHNIKKWDEMRSTIAERVQTKTRQEWQDIFDGTDGCVTPVLDYQELQAHPHTLHRQMLER